ncbi:transposase [Actinomyces procaprae]|uniref:transposase n=1 Tax=Actinomyces procaprae TaxID=2560010 RepID=UPI0010A268E7
MVRVPPRCWSSRGRGRHHEGVVVVGDDTRAGLAEGLVAGADYPRDLAEFRAWFSTDGACRDYLAWLRWPDGFRCPHYAGHGATG